MFHRRAFKFDFQEIEPIYRAFKPMAEKQAFDVSEMAIFTYLQAKAFDKPLVLLPVVLAARLQHGCIVYNTDFHDKITPDMLPGKKVGVRAYSQTTGAWVRNILSQEHGVDLPSIRWITFEGAHLDAYKEPSFVTRAPEGGKDLLAMLMSGEVDAGILGNDLPDDPKIKPVIDNAAEAGRAWFAKHGLVPINHMLVVTKKLAQSHPDIVKEIYGLFKRSKAMAPVKAGAADMRPIGFEAIAHRSNWSSTLRSHNRSSRGASQFPNCSRMQDRYSAPTPEPHGIAAGHSHGRNTRRQSVKRQSRRPNKSKDIRQRHSQRQKQKETHS